MLNGARTMEVRELFEILDCVEDEMLNNKEVNKLLIHFRNEIQIHFKDSDTFFEKFLHYDYNSNGKIESKDFFNVI